MFLTLGRALQRHISEGCRSKRNSPGNKPASESLALSYHFSPHGTHNPQLSPCNLRVCTASAKHRPSLMCLARGHMSTTSQWGRAETSLNGFAAGKKIRWNKPWGFFALLQVCRHFWFSTARKTICASCINFWGSVSVYSTADNIHARLKSIGTWHWFQWDKYFTRRSFGQPKSPSSVWCFFFFLVDITAGWVRTSGN